MSTLHPVDPAPFVALREPFPDELVRQGDVTKPDGFQPRYIQAQHILKRLREATGHAWSFHVKSWTAFPSGPSTQQFLVIGSLSIHLADGTTLTQEHAGCADIAVHREGRTDPGGDLKAAITDAIKKCASQFGVGAQLYEQDESPMQGGYRPMEGMPPPEPQSDPSQEPAMPFQVEKVRSVFASVNLDLQGVCRDLNVATLEALTQGDVEQILGGTHPYIQHLRQHGINPQLPGGLTASEA